MKRVLSVGVLEESVGVEHVLELRRCWTIVEAVENRKGAVGEGRKVVRNFHFFFKPKKNPP